MLPEGIPGGLLPHEGLRMSLRWRVPEGTPEQNILLPSHWGGGSGWM